MVRKVWTIAVNTFHESLRKKILYVLIVFAIIFIGASKFFSFLSREEELKMIKDIGFSSIEFFGALIAIFSSAGSISGEIEKGTIYTLLSKPITRANFVIGKFIGQILIILFNLIIMTVFFITLLLLKNNPFDLELFKTILLIFFELVVISSIAIAIGNFAPNSFNITFSFLLYIAGHLTSYGKQLIERVRNPLFKGFGTIFYTILPNYENFNIKDKVVVGIPVSWIYVGKTITYGFIYICISLLLAIYFFNRKEI